MTKKKLQNNSTEKERPVRIVDFYTDLFFLKSKPVSEAFIQRLAEDLIEWAKQDSSLRITQFWNKLGIPNQCVYKWMDKFENLQLAHDYAMSMIADRRDIGAIEKRFDGNYIKDSMPIYDKQYKAMLEWRASLNKEKETQGNITVVMQPFPELKP